MEPNGRKRPISPQRDTPVSERKKRKYTEPYNHRINYHNAVSPRERMYRRRSPWRRHGKRRDELSDVKRETLVWTRRRRDKPSERRGAMRGRGRWRKNDSAWISNGLFKSNIMHPRDLNDFRCLRSPDLEKFRDDDIRVYRDSQLLCSVASISDGLVWEIQLDTSQPLVKSITNRHRRLLQCGTLISLSNDVFKHNIVYGKVVDSYNKDDLSRNGIVSVVFQQSFNPREARGLFTLVESKINCFAYLDALAALKVKLEKNERLPFEKQIVYHQQSIDPPSYLLSELGGGKGVSFDCLRKKSDTDRKIDEDSRVIEDIIEKIISNVCADISGINTLSTETWPSAEDLGMDISQYRAFSDGLTQELALIQGPPGTGKTVIALKILELFLNNDNIWSKINVGPIILLSYTNHALDQFLEGIIRMPKMHTALTKDIVRVGEQSKTESLDKFNLKHRRKECNTQLQERPALRKAAKHHMLITNAIKTYLTSLVHERFLSKVDAIPDYLFRSLRNQNILSLPADKTYLCEWLEIFLDDFVLHHGVNDEDIEATKELEPEEIPENDRLRLGFDQEDIEAEMIEKVSLGHVKPLLNPTPIVTAEIEEDRKKGIKYRTFVQSEKTAILQEVKRRIMRTRPMSPKEENYIKDVWDLSRSDRWRLYKLWINRILTRLEEDKISAQETYRNTYGRYKELRQSEAIRILKNARVVAMTTTRAAIDHEILRQIHPKIMIIEEAAEVPDHHVLACLVPSLQHLVMIGDHQQLRPAYNDYKTAMRYDLNVSIFERLIRAGLPFQQMQFQHRMRPEIADLLTPTIYHELKNHSSVMEIENVKGIQHNVFFLSHNEKEHGGSHQDVKSYKNQHEVDFIAQFYRYLRLQGYGSKDITVLTMYKEQERLLKIAIRDIEKKEDFLPSLSKPLDHDYNYEQSDSFTAHRDDAYTNINASEESKDNFGRWDRNVGNARVTTVDNFQGEETKIILLSLVRSNSEGGIGFLKEPNRICVALSRAKAGLYIIGDCKLLREKNDLWKIILQKAESKGLLGTTLALYCRNHPQTKTMVSKASDFQKVPDGGCSLKCSTKLVCGHDCSRMCHADDPDHDRRQCNELVKVKADCGHMVQTACHTKYNPICKVECREKLQCGHFCKGTCHSCFAGHLHQKCREKNLHDQECGHILTTDCVLAKWDEKYGGVLFKCQKECKWRCDHEACMRTCNESCKRRPCNVRCTELSLGCSHVCELLKCDHNGDHWCRKCSKETINGGLGRKQVEVRNPHHIRLRLCRCVFETEALDEYLAHQDGISLDGPRCPNCQQEIKDRRYYNYIRNAQIPRSIANLDSEVNSSIKELNKVWEEFGYKDISKRILHYLQNMIGGVRDQGMVNLLIELVESISSYAKAQNNHIANESDRWRCTDTTVRLLDRLRKDRRVLSFQEVREFPSFMLKLTTSLKIFIFKLRSSERMSKKLLSALDGCENIYSIRFTRSSEAVQKLDPTLFREVSMLVMTSIAPHNNDAVRNDSDGM